ncbi:MAG: hypothetical protein ACLGI5_02935 [Thermoleophilia bacterium]
MRGRVPAPEVTVATGAGRSHPAITQHRVVRLDPLDVATHTGIPIAIVPRVLLDISPAIAPGALARACHEAWVRHRTDAGQVEACIARNPRRHGIRKLRTALGADVTLSHLERRFLGVLRRHRLALPRTNIDVDGDKVDCHWPQFGLTVELVSFRYHATRHGFESDVARRRRSRHVAYTYGDVFERTAAMLADLRPRLRSRARTAMAP